jgi:hemerythrin-like domain-containing protein
MRLIESLRDEHKTIEAVALSFVSFGRALRDGAADIRDGARFLRFFRLYAGRFHHVREERVLFPALVRETNVPSDRGPIAALVGDHAELGRALDEVARYVECGDKLDPAAIARLTERYATMLLRHIDAENSVLFPEAEARFRRVSLRELEDASPDHEERSAHEEGQSLAPQYPPVALLEIVRGDGCPCCLSFGVTCDGVEREWSSNEEWEDMLDRVGA